ncbi:hypothetical protein ES703_10727 [subsurface metagenome]
MIDEIFEMILKEARSKPQKDLALNIDLVLLDLFVMLLGAKENIREIERRKKIDENKRGNN